MLSADIRSMEFTPRSCEFPSVFLPSLLCLWQQRLKSSSQEFVFFSDLIGFFLAYWKTDHAGKSKLEAEVSKTEIEAKRHTDGCVTESDDNGRGEPAVESD